MYILNMSVTYLQSIKMIYWEEDKEELILQSRHYNVQW